MTRKIAFITDTHLNQQLVHSNDFDSDKMSYRPLGGAHYPHLETILADIKEKNITEIIFGGDIGSIDANKLFFETVEKTGTSFSIILGNHDKFTEVRKYYKEPGVFDDTLDFSKEDHFFKYIFIDSSAGMLQNKQLDWIAGSLKTSRSVIVFIHHPLLEIPAQLEKIGAALKNRDEVLNVLHTAASPVTVFCGHYHLDDEIKRASVHQYCTIAASYEIGKEKDRISTYPDSFGYRIIELDRDEMTTTTVHFKSPDRISISVS